MRALILRPNQSFPPPRPIYCHLNLGHSLLVQRFIPVLPAPRALSQFARPLSTWRSLTVDGSRYLAPYLCSALEGWGLFGSSSTATLATADWKDHVRSSNDQLLEGLRVQCYMLHAWGGVPLDFEGGYIRLHPCENLTLDYIRTYDACPACPEWLSHGWDSVDELRGPA